MRAARERKNSDVGQIAIALGVVEPVADDEFVGNDKTGIVGANVGDTALFLVSPLGRGITGEVIYVDGGYHILGSLVSME